MAPDPAPGGGGVAEAAPSDHGISAGSSATPSAAPALLWADVCYRVRCGRRARKWILSGVSGYATPGRLLVVLGPSGCGKSTLLNALSGKLAEARGAQLGGRMRSAVLGPLAYVAQEQAFFANLTVRETLELAATLRRGRPAQEGGGAADATAQRASVAQEVDAELRRLGLAECADTRVGGDSGGHAVVGISGGERRRLAIGCETIGASAPAGRPRLVVADEPTSGLDSFQADKVVDQLAALAHSDGAVVLASLHAPRSASFAKADDLLLMAPGGRAVFCGSTCEALAWFASAAGGGHACPAHTNPAEFLIDLVSIDSSSREAEARSRSRVAALCAAWAAEWPRRAALLPPVPDAAAALALAPAATTSAAAGDVRPLGPLRTFRLLLRRSLRQALRDFWVNGTRAAASVLLGAAFGGLNYRLGTSQKSVPRRASLLMQACINTAFLAMVKSLNGFPRERAVVRREVARGTAPGGGGYGVGAYFLAKLLVESPLDALFPLLFGAVAAPLAGLNPARRPALLATLALQAVAASALGLSVSALAPTTEAALAVGPTLMVLSIMLADSGGVFAEVPAALQPLAKLSIVKWGFEGGMGSEFPGLQFDDDVEGLVPMPQQSGRALSQQGQGAKGAPKRSRAGGAAAAAARAAAAALCVRRGEEVLQRMGLPPEGGCRAAATAQLRAIGINLLATYAALRARGGGMAARPQPWDASLLPPPL